ncbi:MAG: hypothetical protein M3Z17_04765 [Gemmatimonadota bacterium]|nr:hypothetical protein [Gemmatimonadota bacterium]
MFDVDVAGCAAELSGDKLTRYGTIVVVGGGCYGSYYLRQLARARKAAALDWERVVIVDRNPACAASAMDEVSLSGVEIHVAEWEPYFREHFAGRSDGADAACRDAIVPSPLMPHLMYDWLRARARARWPDRRIETEPFELPVGFPWQRETENGTRYVSFAEWMCPVNCIEPRICPHTRGERSWSIPDAIRTAMAGSRGGKGLKGPVIFHCTHRAYGVGMLDTAEILAADRFIAAECAGGGDVLIGTVSHCHGALNVLSVSS